MDERLRQLERAAAMGDGNAMRRIAMHRARVVGDKAVIAELSGEFAPLELVTVRRPMSVATKTGRAFFAAELEGVTGEIALLRLPLGHYGTPASRGTITLKTLLRAVGVTAERVKGGGGDPYNGWTEPMRDEEVFAALTDQRVLARCQRIGVEARGFFFNWTFKQLPEEYRSQSEHKE